VDTGEVVPVYGSDGRMMVIIVRQPRPKPEIIEKTTARNAPACAPAGRRKSNHGVDRGKVHRIIAIDIALNDLGQVRARLLKT